MKIGERFIDSGASRIAMRQGDQVYYLLPDHLGSTHVIVDAQGSETGRIKYMPWGETRFVGGESPTEFLYTGQRYEVGIGLNYYNARWYDPYLNHWTQPDTIVPDPYNPLDWNRYSYVQYNPVNNTDPTGHKACSSDGDTFDTCTDPLATPASVLAQEFGITFDGEWSENNQGSAVAAIALVSIQFGKELGLDPVSAFKQVYGLTNGKQFAFGWGSCPECKGAGGILIAQRTYGFKHYGPGIPNEEYRMLFMNLGMPSTTPPVKWRKTCQAI